MLAMDIITGENLKNNKMETKKTVGFIGGKFLPFHMGHTYAILAASNKVDELYVVLSSSKNRDKELCERDGIKYIPAQARLTWLGAAFKDLDNVKIIHIEDDQWDDNYDWAEGARMIQKAINKPLDFVFSSETGYEKHFSKYYPDAKHVVIDDGRETVSVSATEMRKSLYEHWDKIPTYVRPYFVKKVALVGTESCGKTTLAKKLAKFYNTNWVHEVGRDYCEKYGNQLTPEMFNLIGMEHFLLQSKKAEESNKLLFVDSEATITQYYLNMYFGGQKSQLLEEIIKLQDYDLVLHLEPDVKWVADGLRFGGEDKVRKTNNELLKKMYTERKIPLVSITGNYDSRFNKAREAIDALFRRK
jgi:HTH-type transcriptional repressor of NAD biosynthesis genes